VAEPFDNIQAELKRNASAVAGDSRKRLIDLFEHLDPDQAAMVLNRILFWAHWNRNRLWLDSDPMAIAFRGPTRTLRLELLVILAKRLGTQTRAEFLARLTGKADDPDNQQYGLGMVFPIAQGEGKLRDQFLKALGPGIPASAPQVLLEFRSDGLVSPDNECPARKDKVRRADGTPLVPDRLGPDPDPGHGYNYMEIRGTITGHRPDAEYDFHRTRQRAHWCLIRGTWRCTLYEPPGTNDDTHNNDEDLHPDNDHIYSTDSPGPPIPPSFSEDQLKFDDQSDVTEFVYMVNFVETVHVKVGKGAWLKVGEGLEWFTVTWLEKTGTKWRRKPGKSKIAQGSITDLELGATVTGQPPTV
jgi:hypothetical protein